MSDLPTVAISIRQPWAWLIIHGGKDIENRIWKTNFRGPVLIHAAKGMTEDEWEDGLWFARHAWADTGRPQSAPRGVTAKTIERGGVIGVAEIVDCVRVSNSRWFTGEYGFVLANPRPLPFMPFKGALGFFRCKYETDAAEA